MNITVEELKRMSYANTGIPAKVKKKVGINPKKRSIELSNYTGEMIEMFQNGSTIQGVADKFECSYFYAQKVLKLSGMKTDMISRTERNKEIERDHAGDIISMRSKGKTIGYVADFFEISKTLVIDICDRAGYSRYSQLEELWPEMIKMRNDGAYYQDIADKFYCSIDYVKKACKSVK